MALLGVVYRLPQALDRQLRRETGISHSSYSMLSILSVQPEQSMSMGEPAKATSTSPSRLSQPWATSSSAAESRQPSPTNGRVPFARLTGEGMDVLRRVAPTHVAEVRRRVFDRLSRDQIERPRPLASLLDGM